MTDFYTFTLLVNANRTIKLLDRHEPGWYRRINTRRLDLSNGQHDILGQLYNPNPEKLTYLDLDLPKWLGLDCLSEGLLPRAELERLGLWWGHDVDDPRETQHALERFWRQAIITRRESREVPNTDWFHATNRAGSIITTVDHVASSRAFYGALVLDKHEPGWDSVVDPDTLHLSSASFCVLGQVYAEALGDFLSEAGDDEGRCATYIDANDQPAAFWYAEDRVLPEWEDGVNAADIGCDEFTEWYKGSRVQVSYKALTNQWRPLIRKRQATKGSINAVGTGRGVV